MDTWGNSSRDLRLLGIDVAYDRRRMLDNYSEHHGKPKIGRSSPGDRRLLMHAVVQPGYCLRSQKPRTNDSRPWEQKRPFCHAWLTSWQNPPMQ